jgi:predicted DNA-binding transcriptional regulator AlpA
MAPICRTLGISRACAYRKSVGRPARYARAEDRVVTAQIRTVIRTRATGISRSTIERGIAELERENPVLEAD